MELYNRHIASRADDDGIIPQLRRIKTVLGNIIITNNPQRRTLNLASRDTRDQLVVMLTLEAAATGRV